MLGGIFEKNDIKGKIQTFDKKIIENNFWKDKLSAQKILKEKKFFGNIINKFNSVVNELENFEELLKIALEENDTVVIKDCEEKINLLLNQIKKVEIECFYPTKTTISTLIWKYMLAPAVPKVRTGQKC